MPDALRKIRLSPWHAVWLASVVAAGWWVAHQGSPKLPTDASSLETLALALGLYVVATLLRAERWERILRRNGTRVPRAQAYGLVVVGYMGNNVLPARSGELLRAYLLGRSGVSKRAVIGTVVAERVLDAVALGLLFAAFLVGVLGTVSLPSSSSVFITLGVAALLVSIAAGVLIFARNHHLVERLRSFVAPIAGPARALLSLHGFALLCLSMIIWAVEAGVYYAVARATSLNLSISSALYVMVLANLFSLIPAAPGYVGTFDAAVIFGAKAAGGVGGVVTSYLLILRFVLFVPITVAGAVVLVTRYGGWSRFRAAKLEAEAVG